MVGLSRFELLTPRLSSVCSNQLSYRPRDFCKEPCRFSQNWIARASTTQPECQIDLRGGEPKFAFSRKEVIQPQVLLQLPCYDFTPITDHTLGTCLPCGLARPLLVQPAFVM